MSKEKIQNVVQKSLENYFMNLDDQKPTGIYEMVILAVEAPVLKAAMDHANGNQSNAAEILGINRNTLRKKLQQHNLL